MKQIATIILFSLTAHLSVRAASKEIILQRAYEYVSHTWIATSDNIWLPEYCGGKTVETPSWVAMGTNESVPYCWGGYVSVSDFDSGITQEKSAGDANTSTGYGAPDCATGVDCSGFLCQAWGSSRYTTSTLSEISQQLGSYDQLETVDVVNKAGSHVRMVYEVNPNGSITMIESATGNSLVGGDGLYRVFTWTYSAVDLVEMETNGYVPRRYNDFVDNTPIENQTCDQATELYSYTDKNTFYATVSGAEASGITIPTCSGYASSSALDVWFSFTAEALEQVITVEPIGDLDAVVAIYASCQADDLIDCADVSGGPGLVTPLKQADLSVGSEYFIRVFDYGAENTQPQDGSFYIYITHETELLAGDDCTQAFELIAYNERTEEAGEYRIAGDVVGATASGLAIPLCSGYVSSGANDVWYKTTARAEEQTIRVQPRGVGEGALDAVVALYSGTCDNPTFLDCIDVSGGGGLLTELSYDQFTPGDQYFIRIFDYGSVDPNDGRYFIEAFYNQEVENCTDSNEPNNTNDQATVFQVGTDGAVLSSCLSDGGDIDVFQLVLPAHISAIEIKPEGLFTGFEFGMQQPGGGVNFMNEQQIFSILDNADQFLVVRSSGTDVGNYVLSIEAISQEQTVATISGGKVVLVSGEEHMYLAMPEEGYDFGGWIKDGHVVSTVAVFETETIGDYEPLFYPKKTDATVAEGTTTDEVILYPNPVAAECTVENLAGRAIGIWRITTLTGKTQKQGIANEPLLVIAVNELPQGTYLFFSENRKTPIILVVE